MSEMEREEVLDASTASAEQMLLSCVNTRFLTSMFSLMASTTRSHESIASSSVAGVMREQTADTASSTDAASRPCLAAFFSAILRTEDSTAEMPRSSAPPSASTATTSYLLLAASCAMPWPIEPMPSTPTRRNSSADPLIARAA